MPLIALFDSEVQIQNYNFIRKNNKIGVETCGLIFHFVLVRIKSGGHNSPKFGN